MIRWHYQMVYHLHHFILKFRQHLAWLYALIILSVLLALLNINQGEMKPINIWSWLDITGEGASVLFIAVWLVILLASRSKGQTTTLLAFGLLGIYLSNLQDFLDEFIKLPQHVIPWDSLIESLPIGLVIFTIGMIYWYREQQAIHAYLAQRSTAFENNHTINRETGLAPMKVMFTDIEQMSSQSPALLQLNLLHIHSDKRSQTIIEQAALKGHCADVLLNNLPDEARAYHLTGGHYAIITTATNEKNHTLITKLKHAIQTHCCHHKKEIYVLSVACHSCSLNEGRKKADIEKLVMESVKHHTRKQFLR